MRIIHSAIVIAAVAATSCANAQYSGGTVKIGILTDMSSIFSDGSDLRYLARRAEPIEPRH